MKKRKINLIVSKCIECPYRDDRFAYRMKNQDVYYYCKNQNVARDIDNVEITNLDAIPNWCPLEEV